VVAVALSSVSASLLYPLLIEFIMILTGIITKKAANATVPNPTASQDGPQKRAARWRSRRSRMKFISSSGLEED